MRYLENLQENIKFKSQLECNILAVTANTLIQASEKFAQIGIKQIIYKPVSLLELKNAVEKYYI